MKKNFIALLILVICLFSSCAFAYEMWKWSNPHNIAVYIPQNDDKSVLMKKAFEDWQNKTKNNLAFRFVKSPNTKSLSLILR